MTAIVNWLRSLLPARRPNLPPGEVDADGWLWWPTDWRGRLRLPECEAVLRAVGVEVFVGCEPDHLNMRYGRFGHILHLSADGQFVFQLDDLRPHPLPPADRAAFDDLTPTLSPRVRLVLGRATGDGGEPVTVPMLFARLPRRRFRPEDGREMLAAFDDAVLDLCFSRAVINVRTQHPGLPREDD